MIISIFSPKGGVGKTTIALALSKMAGKRLKTCTIEFDFSPGDFVSILDLERKKNIFEAVNGNLDWAIQRPRGQDFDVIVGGYPDTYEMIKQDKLKKMMEELEKRYELIIVDIQPSFIEGCIDIFDMSKDILLIVEDDHSVNSRAIGNIDWARANGFIDLRKVKMIVNKMQKRELTYVNITEIKLPIIYKVPYIKKLNNFENKKMLNHAQNILNVLYPNIFSREAKSFLFFKKKELKQVKSSEVFTAEKNTIKEENHGETDEIYEMRNINELNVPEPVLDTKTKKDESEEVAFPPKNNNEYPKFEIEKEQNKEFTKRGEDKHMKVYVNTGYKELDNIFKSKLETTDNLINCDAAIISYIANKEYIKNLISAGKRIILLADETNYDLIETAKEIGIKDIFFNSVDPEEIINNLINDKGAEEEMLLKENEVEFNNEPVLLEYNIEAEEKTENIPNIQEEKYNDKLNVQKDEKEDEVNTVLLQIKNILDKNKEIYEERISMQEEKIKEKEEIIKEKEEIIAQKEEEINELRKIINEYKEREEERKKIISELQKLLQ
jgi:MinD-like ATPase involved in chromosome partitioning or flagellar assembly